MLPPPVTLLHFPGLFLCKFVHCWRPFSVLTASTAFSRRAKELEPVCTKKLDPSMIDSKMAMLAHCYAEICLTSNTASPKSRGRPYANVISTRFPVQIRLQSEGEIVGAVGSAPRRKPAVSPCYCLHSPLKVTLRSFINLLQTRQPAKRNLCL
jgi:hypothetical protein